ncbi:unnamed protein product [Caenorhabditis sp. 36 PRJEB53466]|nr:unnamed protein product [Caenorhabditis sp. 36 PRJEB53466]
MPLRYYSEHSFYSNNTLLSTDFMEGIFWLTVFTHVFSYTFNFVLLYVVTSNKAIKTKSYITHLIWVELLLNVCQHFSVEKVLQMEDQTHVSLVKNVCIFFMSLQMWTVNTIRYIMTFVMASNRFVCSVYPGFNKYFDSEMITFFGVGIWLIAFIASWYLLLLGCFPRFNTETFVMDTSCYFLKWPDFIYKSHYLLILTLALNIMMVVYAKLRRSGCFNVAVARVSVVAAQRRSRTETVFVLQSCIVFLFMAYDAVYTYLRKAYETEFHQLPQNAQIMLGWLNIYSANYMNFLLYFLFHKVNRVFVVRTILCVKSLVSSRIYMIHMIISELIMNISQNIIIEFPYFFPQDPAFYTFPLVKFFEMFNVLGYQFKFYIAIVMAINRLWVVVKPLGSEVFSPRWLNVYLTAGWLVLMCPALIVLIPDDCYIRTDLVEFQIMTTCLDPESHKTRMVVITVINSLIHIVFPWLAASINLVVYVCVRRRKANSQITTKSGEMSLVINSLVVSLVLVTNYIYNYVLFFCKDEISSQSAAVQSVFSFFNLYGCSFFNFIVYFILSPTTRNIMLSMISAKQVTRVSTLVAANG